MLVNDLAATGSRIGCGDESTLTSEKRTRDNAKLAEHA
jgi:hypothetical protein